MYQPRKNRKGANQEILILPNAYEQANLEPFVMLGEDNHAEGWQRLWYSRDIHIWCWHVHILRLLLSLRTDVDTKFLEIKEPYTFVIEK